jgi:AcrR family transcriptional regulator
VVTPDVNVTGSGPRRADARDNRARVLAAAEEVFGRAGAAASTEDVARRAGVGIATVFRHFPTKVALLEAVWVAHVDRLVAYGDGLRESADPGRAFRDFFAHVVEDAATKLAIGDALLRAGSENSRDVDRASTALRRTVGTLLERAQRAGAVRDDVELPELYTLLVGASRAAAVQPDPEVRARALAILFDGLAPGAPGAPGECQTIRSH